MITFLRREWRASITILAMSLALYGCACKDSHPRDNTEIPQGAIPQSAGTYTCQWQTAQAAEANLDHLMIYENEWYLGGRDLGPFGQRHLGQLCDYMKRTPCKAVIEPHFNYERNRPDNELNQARLNVIITQLAACGIENAPDRVTLGLPCAEGLNGTRAATVGGQYLQGGENAGGGNTSSGGQFGGTGTTSQGIGGLGF